MNTNKADIPTAGRATQRVSRVRRAAAGLTAAVAVAVGGLSLVSPQDAQAAGVHQQTYVVQASNATVEQSTPLRDRSKN